MLNAIFALPFFPIKAKIILGFLSVSKKQILIYVFHKCEVVLTVEKVGGYLYSEALGDGNKARGKSPFLISEII